MIIWLLERPDNAGQRRSLELMQAAAAGSAAAQWRLLSASRLWAECVGLAKDPNYPQELRPSLIEFPSYWRLSLAHLGILAEDTAFATGVPLMTGLTMLYGREELLSPAGKKPVSLSFEEWMMMMAGSRRTFSAKPFDMSLDAVSALWWVYAFGGEFLDPLNNMPAFGRAEALEALASMFEILSGPGAGVSDERFMARRFLMHIDFRQARRFPENAAFLLSLDMPRAYRAAGANKIFAAAPPRVSLIEEYMFGVTTRGATESGGAAISLIESWTGDNRKWVEIAGRMGLFPARRDLWRDVLELSGRSADISVFESSLAAARSVPEILFLPSLLQIFEKSLARVYWSILREGRVDGTLIATETARAASEFRLMAALYDTGASKV